MADKITIGCRLPSGYTLEVGLQTTVKGGPQNRPVSMVKRTAAYKRVRLGGTHMHTKKLRMQKIQMPSLLAPEPFFTDVDAEVWLRWKKEHPDAAVLKNGDIFEVDDEKNKKAITLDIQARPQPLSPVDPEKKIVTDDGVVEKANFDDDDDKK